ncbi:hypothetical protein M407DRAFT_30606 [Tulasnella calospora MUT 4182]|uniref:Uncharacterized protein n=1 Tax=Tulasnella calospora MUT 4182 TaxID=1051891 RepID=A0A0C3PXE7_9AGAM|nr:hypothetical protein M407DRAFT_30606 [Tulasnella calospora MUT 4182]
MSFVRNFEDNQSPADAGGVGPAPQSIPSERASTKISTVISPVADSFVRNFSDNQSPGDGDSPNASVAAVPGSPAGAADATSGEKVLGWNTNRGFETAAEKSREFDRRVDEGFAKSYTATHHGVERTMDKMKSSSKTDVREGELLLPAI